MLTNRTQKPASLKKKETGCKLVNGTRLFYEVQGEGQPIVFIHDFSLDHRMWDDQFHYFSKWYTCIRFDLRGYGLSALPGHQYYTFHNDLKALLISLDIHQPVILVGHSLGGLIAANFALRFPHFTKAIVLANTQIEGHTFKNFKLDILFSVAKRKGIDYAKRKWFAHNLFAHARKNKPVSEAIWQMIHFYSGWHFVDKTAMTIEEPSTWDHLENIDIPSLIVYSDLIDTDFKELSEEVGSRIPKARKVVIENAGYMINMESPVAFNKVIEKFLSSLAFE